MGVNATWDLLNALTPAVPFFNRVTSIVESAFGLHHSRKHTLPDEGLDLKGLGKVYTDSMLFSYRKGRMRSGAAVNDAFTSGLQALMNTKWLQDHFNTRSAYMSYTNFDEIYSTDAEFNPEDAATDGGEDPNEIEEVGLQLDIDYEIL